MKNILKFWKSILWTAVIAFLLLLPGDKIPEKKLLDIPNLDKVVHAGLFMLLEFLLLFDAKSLVNSKSISLKLTVLTIGYALLTEGLQYFFTVSRTGDWFDFFADVTGILIGWVVFLLYSNIITQTSPRNL